MGFFFISYQHDSMAFADELRETIQDNDLIGWMDHNIQGGDKWKEVIDNAIKDCYGVILVVTPAALASQYVTYEWSFAMGLSKTVVPILLESVTNWHPKLGDVQYRNFIDPTARNWPQLIDDLKAIRNRNNIPEAIQSAKRALRGSHREPDWKEAIEFLLGYPDPAASEALADELSNPSPYISLNAAIALAEKANYTDQRPISRLCGELGGQQYGDQAARILGRIGGERAAQCLIDALEYVQDTVGQRNLVKALGECKHPIAAPALAQFLDGGNVETQIEAAAGLVAIAPPDLLPKLIATFEDRHTVRQVRELAMEAAAGIDDPQVVARLTNLLATITQTSAHPELLVFNKALLILSAIGNEQTFTTFRELSISPNYKNMRPQIVDAINRLQETLSHKTV